MPIRVYNTLTRQKEDFQPVRPPQVGMYLCGPTVYKPSHIGHMVGPVIFDTVKKYLVYSGYQVKFVINITDVDDKLIVGAAEQGTTVEKLAKAMTADYFDNLEAVGVDSVDIFPYATEHIREMHEMIGKLIDKGYAYPLNGDVYFDVTKDEDYGALSNRSIAEIMTGTRAEVNDAKRHPADFALWKGSKPGEPAWDSPWGPGRPGWHIECSAMSLKHIGETLDIHGGGLDLMFPHHENELAQSESCTGHKFSKYWLHNGLMQSGKGAAKVGGGHSRHGEAADALAEKAAQEEGKISKSKGAGSFRDLLQKHDAESIRFFLLSTHYRSPIEFTDKNIIETAKGLEGFHRLIETYQRVTGQDYYKLSAPKLRTESTPLTGEPADFFRELATHRDRFCELMDDDFNTGGAVGVLFELRRVINAFITAQQLESPAKARPEMLAALTTAMTLLRELTAILGFLVKPGTAQAAGADDALVGGLMELVLELRADARAAKNWPVSDKIRNKLNQLKIVVEDRTDVVTWRRE